MAMKLLSLCAFIPAVLANNEVSVGALNLQTMDKVFARTDEAHKASLDAIMQGMSVSKAAQLLEKSDIATPALMQAANLALGKGSSLRKQPKGYSGIDGARQMLNDMIFESMAKYDSEIAKCTEYYATQCTAMEACRSQIAASNYIAANSRALILDAQAVINKAEVEIPVKEEELKQHNIKCKHEITKMVTRLKIVMGDIAIMTMILEMTDCEKKLLQMKDFGLLHCEDQCTKKHFIKFDHDGLQKKVSQLQSVSRGVMADTFADLFQGIEGLEGTEFLQMGAEQTPFVNKTKFNNPPVPRTKVPRNPCTDPNKGAPSAQDKAAAKCTLGPSPQCYKLQERFLLIQAGIQDERDELMSQIQMLEHFCAEVKMSYQTQIQDDKDMLSNAETKLAAATDKEATAGETARQTAAEHSQLDLDLNKQMKTCSGNYINFETELCALKKIRGELYKMKGGGHSAFFQDCEVSKWDPEECTKTCNKGNQKLTRSVLTHPQGGAKCLPLAAERSCNTQPCPINCKLSIWSGWSKCSAECGGGVQQRLREVEMEMKYNGKPCGQTSQTKSCQAQACEKDCVLSSWTKWSSCSKECDGGTKRRQKFVSEPALGAGKCATAWDPTRLEYKQCAMHRCKVLDAAEPMTCNRSLDVVLLLDGSGSMGKKGWAAEMKAAQYFVGSFMKNDQAKLAVILYSGPRTWGGVFRCVGQNQAKVDLEKTCRIKTVMHFTNDFKKLKGLITGLAFPKGSTLTSLALMTAKAELTLGSQKKRSVVVVFTDGRPLSYRRTELAARSLRKTARLLWVPMTKNAPLKSIKKWATRRWEENVVSVEDWAKLEKPEVITHIIADICPEEAPKVKFGRRR